MGKIVDEGVAARPSNADEAGQNSGLDRRSALICRYLNLRCVLFVVLGLAVLVSTVFWLLPLVRHSDHEDLELWHTGAPIEASFKLQKPVSQLTARSTIMKLEYDILEEIGVSNSKVVILSLHCHRRSNWTRVVFGVLPYGPNSSISNVGLSILKSSFIELVTKESNLQLSSDLFGVPSFFQMLTFPGGITIALQKKVFLLQKAQLHFNFTLGYPMHQVQEYFVQLKNQLKSGLRLRQHEALYVELTNLNGSTVSPPVIVQASIYYEIGITFAPPRVKQLAQMIQNSPARNLGLNHTVFGKVKEVRLSSFLQHSLGHQSPSPAPGPHHNHHHHGHHHHFHHHHCHPDHHHCHRHRHHHHHHHHHHSFQLAPTSLPPPHPVTNSVRRRFHKSPSPLQSHSAYDLGTGRNVHASPSISPSAPKPILAERSSAPLFSVPAESPLLTVYFGDVQHESDKTENSAPRTAALRSISSPSPSRTLYSAPRSAMLRTIFPSSSSPTSSSLARRIPWFLALGALLMHL